MLRSVNDLEGYAIGATDGAIGHVRDFYFDDEAWVIRYLVIDTGSWLASRKVLISPIAIGHPDWMRQLLPASVTKEQVRNSPDIDTEKPVSRQHEIGYLGYYNYPYYWGGVGLWAGSTYPGMMLTGVGYGGIDAEYRKEQSALARSKLGSGQNQDDALHLRSCNAVMNYHIEATDGAIGHICGLLVDEDTWAIRYLVVDTSNWWFGHKVLIAPKWIRDVSWPDSTASVNLTQQAVRDAPPYDPTTQLDRMLESGVYHHDGHSGNPAGMSESQAAFGSDSPLL